MLSFLYWQICKICRRWRKILFNSITKATTAYPTYIRETMDTPKQMMIWKRRLLYYNWYASQQNICNVCLYDQHKTELGAPIIILCPKFLLPELLLNILKIIKNFIAKLSFSTSNNEKSQDFPFWKHPLPLRPKMEVYGVFVL